MAVSGIYAYVADDRDGLRVIDVSDPTNPTEVGSYDPASGDQFRGVAVSGSYAYAADGLGGFAVFDITACGGGGDLIFSDDFESGDTSAWSETVP